LIFIGHAVEQTHWKLIFSRRRARSSRGAALVDEALGFCGVRYVLMQQSFCVVQAVRNICCFSDMFFDLKFVKTATRVRQGRASSSSGRPAAKWVGWPLARVCTKKTD